VIYSTVIFQNSLTVTLPATAALLQMRKCDLSDLLLTMLPPLQLRGGARRRDGCGRWSPRQQSPCRRGRPRRSSARHCATASSSARFSTASIPVPSPRCVSDAQQNCGENVTNFRVSNKFSFLLLPVGCGESCHHGSDVRWASTVCNTVLREHEELPCCS